MTFQYICHRNRHSYFWHIFMNYVTKFLYTSKNKKNERCWESNLQPQRQDDWAITIELLIILQTSNSPYLYNALIRKNFSLFFKKNNKTAASELLGGDRNQDLALDTLFFPTTTLLTSLWRCIFYTLFVALHFSILCIAELKW